MGRPITLTDEIADELVALIRIGMSKHKAAACVGVERRKFQDWIARGAKQESGPLREFSDRIKAAEAQAEARDLKVIDDAATQRGDWRASAWRRERLQPDRYAQRLEIRYKERALREILEHLRNTLDPERYEEIYASLAAFDNEGGEGEDDDSDE